MQLSTLVILSHPLNFLKSLVNLHVLEKKSIKLLIIVFRIFIKAVYFHPELIFMAIMKISKILLHKRNKLHLKKFKE